MALLVHHWNEVVDLWLEAVDASDDEGLRALLEYVICSILLLSLTPPP